MIFTFPAIVSSNVDQRLLPGLLRTLEKYYLNHMLSAISNFAIKFIIDVDKNGPRGISIESEKIDLTNILLEADPKTFQALASGDQPFPGRKNSFFQVPPLHDIKSLRDVTKNAKNLKDWPKYKSMLSSPLIVTPYEYKKIMDKKLEDDRNNIKTGLGTGGMDYSVVDWWREVILTRAQGSPPGYIVDPETDAIYAPEDRSEFEEASKGWVGKKDKEEYEGKVAQAEIGKGVKAFSLNVDNKLDFVPTMVIVETDVWVRREGVVNKRPLQRSIAVGVKIIPVISKNFSNMYRTLRDDYFASQFRYMYKTMGRMVLRTLWSGAQLKKLKRWYELAMGTNAPDELGSSKLDWYMNVLLSKKALVDAGGFNPAPGGLKYRQFTSAIAVMNKDEKEDMFSEPGRLQRLFNMGWNSFVIIDPSQHTATFCSNLDRGKCETIPLNQLFHAMNAETVYKSYEDLQRSAGGFMRKIQSSPITMKQVLK